MRLKSDFNSETGRGITLTSSQITRLIMITFQIIMFGVMFYAMEVQPVTAFVSVMVGSIVMTLTKR